jgi:hypothetical protein
LSFLSHVYFLFVLASAAKCPGCKFEGATKYVHDRHLKRRPHSCQVYSDKLNMSDPKRMNKTQKRAYNAKKKQEERKTHVCQDNTTVCVVQYEDRPKLWYFEALRQINKQWCQKQGIETSEHKSNNNGSQIPI